MNRNTELGNMDSAAIDALFEQYQIYLQNRELLSPKRCPS